MTGLRVLLITRRFWPFAGGIERTLAHLATGFRRRGAEPTILTARGAEDWPARVDYRGTPVIRLTSPPGRAWGTLRYLVALARWLRSHRAEFDVVCVSQLRFDAYAALCAIRSSRMPVVLRAEAAGSSGDARWQQVARFGGRVRKRCQAAPAIIAAEPAAAEELRAAGYAPERLSLILNGVVPTVLADARRRLETRIALADTNSELTVATDAPVVVYAGRLALEAGLGQLLQAWRAVIHRWPAAKLWLAGEGPDRDELQDRIRDLELRYQVVLPGVFEDLTSVLSAANLYVDPADEPGMPLELLEAMVTGLPVLTTFRRREHMGDRLLCGAAVPGPDPVALSQTLLQLLAEPPTRAALTQARAEVLRTHSLQRMVDEHLRLFRRLV
jgi:glycosyltransferase involved in cell wall biosynthesis